MLIDNARAYFTARSRDVSPDGIGVEVGANLAAGTLVDVYFELPSGVAVEVRAQLVRSDGASMGLRFVELGDEERRALIAYCSAWRDALLQRCAQRAGAPVLRVTSKAESAYPARSYAATEAESGVRPIAKADPSRRRA